MMEAIGEGIYRRNDKYYTINLTPGQKVYGEPLVQKDGFEYREWNPERSKLCAFLEKEGSLPVDPEMDILYLGAGDGTTVSHLSDIVTDGKIFAVELARNPYRNLNTLSKRRKNIFPIMADARNTEKYEDIVGSVDFLYQDISQRDQPEIYLKNLKFLKEDHFGMIAVKAKSIDVSRSPKKIFDEVQNRLQEKVSVESRVNIGDRHKGHAMLVIKK